MFNFSGKRPKIMGPNKGRLSRCPKTPNCVCSEDEDNSHHIAPLKYAGDVAVAMQRLAELIRTMEGATIAELKADYLRAEFKSSFFGFVDDVEFFSKDKGTLQVRSASRLGQADFGVNRRRIESIRAAFTA